MKRSLSASVYLSFMLSNLGVLKDTCDTAVKISQAQNCVQTVEVLNPYLVRTAPVADELKALIQSGAKPRASIKQLEAQILAALDNERLGERAMVPRDAKWLAGGRKFFEKFVLPVLMNYLQQELLGS